jgi:predicted site-specific integrase-resolvase
MQTEQIDPILPLAVLAERLGIHRDTLRRCGRRGELKIIQLTPRRLGVLESEFKRWFESRAAA